MPLKTLEPYCQELLAFHSILFALGFEPDDLFVALTDEGSAIVIRKEDKAYRFQATDKPLVKSNDEFVADWAAAITTWNTSSQEEKQKLVETSSIRQYAVPIITILSNEGILPTDVIDFICPFCSGKVTANQAKYTVLHSMPICEKFKNLEPTEFLATSLKNHIN